MSMNVSRGEHERQLAARVAHYLPDVQAFFAAAARDSAAVICWLD
ncbi:hypothetical protein ACIP95_19130 [Micromonospora parva]|uniref:Uncharacterized protein n=1 Tax=Micromonospora parva TaxID=1464048 RepID=A0ABW6VQ82_9ACTN|nr:hypothetical protein [Micromonospora parva]